MTTLSCHQTATSRVSPQFGCPCVGEVHQAPMSTGYMNAAHEAEGRLSAGWKNPACPECGHHGWLPPSQPLADLLAAKAMVENTPPSGHQHLTGPKGTVCIDCGSPVDPTD